MEKQLNNLLKEIKEDENIISLGGRLYFKKGNKKYMWDYELTDIERKRDTKKEKKTPKDISLILFILFYVATVIIAVSFILFILFI